MTPRPEDWGGPFADPAERLLEFALGELFRAEPAPDLSAAIVAAWRSGERGSGIEDLAPAGAGAAAARASSAPAGTRRPRPLVTRARVPRLAAAAAVLAVGLGVAWWASRGPTAEELERERWAGAAALASTPLELVRSGPVPAPDRSPEPPGRLRLRPGDAVLVPGAEPAPIELPAGGELVLGPRAVLTFEPAPETPTGAPAEPPSPLPADLRLRLGALGIRPGDARALVTDFARVELAPGSDLRAALSSDRAVFPRGLDALGEDRALVLSSEPFSRLLALRLDAGSATLVRGGEREPLVPGVERVLASDPGRVDSVSRADQARLSDLLASAMPDYDWFRPMRLPKPPVLPESEIAMDDLVELLRARPERWDLVEAFEKDARADAWTGAPVPPRFVELLALEGSPRAVARARDLWIESPESFDLDALLALASRGAFELEREVRARVQAFDGKDPAEILLPAAWLALRGDDSGRELLLAEVDRAWNEDDPTLRALAAAAGLARLGDGEHWRLERTRFADEIRRDVANDELATARRRAIRAEILLAELASEVPRLDYFERRVDMRTFGDAGGLETAADVLALADRLAAD